MPFRAQKLARVSVLDSKARSSAARSRRAWSSAACCCRAAASARPARLVGGGTFGSPLGFEQAAAALQFGGGGLSVHVVDVAGRRAVEVETMRRIHQRLQVRRAGGVAVQEGRQRLAREDARRALLDVVLDAQLDRQRAAGAEQRRKQLGQAGGAGRRREIHRYRRRPSHGCGRHRLGWRCGTSLGRRASRRVAAGTVGASSVGAAGAVSFGAAAASLPVGGGVPARPAGASGPAASGAGASSSSGVGVSVMAMALASVDRHCRLDPAGVHPARRGDRPGFVQPRARMSAERLPFAPFSAATPRESHDPGQPTARSGRRAPAGHAPRHREGKPARPGPAARWR